MVRRAISRSNVVINMVRRLLLLGLLLRGLLLGPLLLGPLLPLLPLSAVGLLPLCPAPAVRQARARCPPPMLTPCCPPRRACHPRPLVQVGSAQETWNYKFEEVHIEWPARLARAIKESGKVERFIHLRCARGAAAEQVGGGTNITCRPVMGAPSLVTALRAHAWPLLTDSASMASRLPPPPPRPCSCLGAEADAPSRRLRTKAAGEEVVRSELGPISTIFKPAVMTGTEDRLFNM